MTTPLKIIHIPYCFYPDAVGGTEVYVASLAEQLQQRGHDVVIAAPWHEDAEYVHDKLRVRRFAVDSAIDLRAQYGDGDEIAAASFDAVLADEKPGLVHLHALTSAISPRLVDRVTVRGVPVVFTVHTPAVSCGRGTLLRWGTEVCDGRLDLDLCTRCSLQALGLPRVAAEVVGRAPVFAGRTLGDRRLAGGHWTALRMRELVDMRHSSFRRFVAAVDRIVVLCRWNADLLERNGVPADKVTVSPHGLPHLPPRRGRVPSAPTGDRPLRLAFLGRLDPTKGLDTPIRALRALPGDDVHIDVYGIAQGEGGLRYRRFLETLVGRDDRIAFLDPVPCGQVVNLLASYDALIAPSDCLETGPLVVLEAFAAGTPVIGSRLGGIAELVEDGVNGLLVEPRSVEGWQDAIHRLLLDGELRSRLRTGVRPPRSMSDVATDMEALYLPLTTSLTRVAHG